MKNTGRSTTIKKEVNAAQLTEADLCGLYAGGREYNLRGTVIEDAITNPVALHFYNCAHATTEVAYLLIALNDGKHPSGVKLHEGSEVHLYAERM